MTRRSLAVRQPFAPLAVLVGASICFLAAQSPGQAAEATATTESVQVKRWRYLLGSFPPASMRSASEEEKARVAEDFFTEDVSRMPPEWRYVFVRARLTSYQVNGKWDDMIAIRDELMKPRTRDPNRSQLDADLLHQIATYFSHIVFLPPHDHATSSDLEVNMYWIKNYRDLEEVERIYKYVIDHFDLQYVRTIDAVIQLAFTQLAQGKWKEALETYKRFDLVDIDALFSVDRIHRGHKTLQEAADHRKEMLRKLRISKANLPHSMIKAARWLPDADALRELAAIAEKYREDQEVQKKVQELIQRKFPIEDTGIE